MKLLYPDYGLSFKIFEGYITSIVLERCDIFEKMILSMSNQIMKREEKLLFFIKEQKQDIDKYFEIITSPLDITYNKRELQKKLYCQLVEDMRLNDELDRISDAYSMIASALDALKALSDFEIDFNSEYEYMDILKHFDVSLREPEGTFFERFIEYAEAVHKLTGRSIFVLANCDAYISDEEYEYLSKWTAYEGISLIMLRNKQRPLYTDKNEYIIDVDLCEIH